MHEASYNKKYILIGEGRLLITAREEFLDTASSKIQPRGGCIVYPIYRLEGLSNTEFCMQYTTIVSGIDYRPSIKVHTGPYLVLYTMSIVLGITFHMIFTNISK